MGDRTGRQAVPGVDHARNGGVGNFLGNLRAPAVLANQLLQGDRAGERDAAPVRDQQHHQHAGPIRPATDWGYSAQHEDFGQTLAVYGMPAGPFLVLPLLGPCNLRDAVGRVGDYLAINAYIDTDALYAVMGAAAINEEEAQLERRAELRANSLDLYAAARSAYEQKRGAEIRNGASPAGDPGYDGIFEEQP